MKKILILVGVLIAANILVAQDKKKEEAKNKEQVEAFKKRLELTDDQVEQLKSLRKKYRPELRALRKDDSKGRSKKLRSLADLNDEREKELSAILSNTQLEEMRKFRIEIRKKIRDRRKMIMKRRSKG